MTTTILLVDDHQMMREGLNALLEKHADYEVVGEAESGREALDLADRLQPDIVIMDVGLPDLNGIEATRQLIAGNGDLKVIALSMHSDRRYVVEMLKAGAGAYLLKNSASDELIRAINAVQNDESFLSPRIASTVIERMLHTTAPVKTTAFNTLSAREREVLQILAEGKTSKQIAGQLHLAVRTVEAHRREIMRKLDLHSVAELTKYAIREGLTTLEA